MFQIFGLSFFKQKTAYEMRISDWSSDVCSSDLDQAGDDLAALLQGDRDGEVRQAVQEVAGAVEGIDDPAPPALVARRHLGGFLHEKAIAGTRLLQLVADRLFGLVVGGGDEVRRALARNLQVLDLAEVTLQAARRLVDVLEHAAAIGRAHDYAQVTDAHS